MTLAAVGLGSNLGDRDANLNDALHRLSQSADVQVTARSRIYESDPMGPQDQPRFLNMACLLETCLEAHQLLQLCKSIEQQMGRKQGVRWGPRLIDLDILLFGDIQLNDNRLQLPHPGLSERAFVLLPLQELLGNHPVPGLNTSVAELAKAVSRQGIAVWQAADKG